MIEMDYEERAWGMLIVEIDRKERIAGGWVRLPCFVPTLNAVLIISHSCSHVQAAHE